MTGPSFHEQASEAELHYLGLRDQVTRAINGKIKRSPEEIERWQIRMAAAEAGAHTLKTVAERRLAPEQAGERI